MLAVPSCTKEDPQRHLNLGNWYLQRGLVDEAIMEFREVSRLFSGDASKLKRKEYNIIHRLVNSKRDISLKSLLFLKII